MTGNAWTHATPLPIKQRKGDVKLTQNQFLVGAEADAAVNAAETGGNDNTSFTSLKSGTTLTVKVVGLKDYFQFYSYGIFDVIDSFVAEKPSKKSAKGYPIDDLTPWDRAWKYHKDLSQDWNDFHGQEAGKYRCKARFAMAFYDITTGEVIAVDLSRNQHQAAKSAIEKYAKRIDKLAFELSKTGEKTGTVVSLAPIIDMDEDLTDKQRENFTKAPAEIDMTQFFTAPFFADEAEQVKLLTQAGFDVSLIGYGAQAGGSTALDDAAGTDDPLPF